MPKDSHYGHGIVTPLQRLGGDFNTASGVELVRSCLLFLLGTRQGDVPWRPGFGTAVERQRLKNMSDEDLEVLRISLETAVARHEPRVQLLGLEVEKQQTELRIHLTWRLAGAGTQGIAPASSTETMVF